MTACIESHGATFTDAELREAIIELARNASIEMNARDGKDLAASRRYLQSGTRIHVSHLLRQTWVETVTACRAASENGYAAVPHVPVRLVSSAEVMDGVLRDLVAAAGVDDVLLVAGDYPQPAGPYSQTLDVLRTDVLASHGIGRVSFAGHPEGHPSVDVEIIRAAEREKVRCAVQSGLAATLLTQFFFEADPFLAWTNGLRSNAVQARIVAGLCGPAKMTTLLKYAMRCGIGQSLRALSARPASFGRLLGEQGPENLLRALAEARLSGSARFDGIHLFCFGGFLRTCQWLHAVVEGRFALDDETGIAIVDGCYPGK